MNFKKNVKYVIITPVKNEEQFIGKTINSVRRQTILPLEWVIINDGSTDSTEKIISGYVAKFPWIKLLSMAHRKRKRGGHIVHLFKSGFDSLISTDYEYIVKLDGDIEFGSEFFERAFNYFSSVPNLGISSGFSSIKVNNRWIEEKSVKDHTLGATKIYKKECFDDIGGLLEAMGWDGIDEIKARMLGWKAKPVPALFFKHLRREGKATGLFTSGLERGKGSYYMGYHPAYLIARSIRRMFQYPPFIDGTGILLGYFSALLRGEERLNDVELINFIRKNQLRKLFFLKSEV